MPQEELLLYYHNEFVETLKGLSYLKEVPSLLDLNLEIMRHGSLIAIMSLLFLPMAFIDPSTNAIEDMMPSDPEESRKFMIKLLNLPDCKALLQKEIKIWANNGWI